MYYAICSRLFDEGVTTGLMLDYSHITLLMAKHHRRLCSDQTLNYKSFLIYVNDIIYDLSSDIFLYDDDTILIRVVTDPLTHTRIMNDDLELLNVWSKQWVVTFSPAKPQQLIVTRKTVNSIMPNSNLTELK